MAKHLVDEPVDDTTDTTPGDEPVDESSTRPSVTAAGDPTTEWETVTADNIRVGDTVRATNEYGTIIFGVAAPNASTEYAVNIGGVGVSQTGWTFERVVPPVILPDEQGWYATEDESIGLDTIFLLDDSGRWWSLSQNGEFTQVDNDYVLKTGNLVPIIRKNELISNIMARVEDSSLDDDAKATMRDLVTGQA